MKYFIFHLVIANQCESMCSKLVVSQISCAAPRSIKYKLLLNKLALKPSQYPKGVLSEKIRFGKYYFSLNKI